MHEERYWYPDDGGEVWVSGYTPVGADGRYLARDAPELAARGIRIAGVAGAARHHDAALQAPSAAPGCVLSLRPDPANPHDANAIAVHLATGEQVGWVPRELAAELAGDAAAWSALVLRERRASPRDPRIGLTMLLARAPDVSLRCRA